MDKNWLILSVFTTFQLKLVLLDHFLCILKESAEKVFFQQACFDSRCMFIRFHVLVRPSQKLTSFLIKRSLIDL